MPSNSSANQTNLQSLDKTLNNSTCLSSSSTSISPLDLSLYTASSSSVLFIDANVSQIDSLVAGVAPGTEVHVLNPAKDAVAQITNTLLGRQGISSLHIITHGNAGSVDFSSGSLNTHSINSYTNDLQVWGRALTADADILLYGCNIAAGEAGVNFVQQLSGITGADVAASNDLTGSSRKGGNWVFEINTGKIESASALLAQTMAAYDSTLNTPITINTASAVINNPTPAADEQFGSAITSGQSGILIGAPGVDSRRGEAYLFNLNGTLSQTFANPSSNGQERFGVAVASNVSEYFVSAPYYDASVADVGRAYKLNSNGVVQLVYDNSVNNDDSEFGTAIAILNDGTVVIGAPEKGKAKPEDNAGQVSLFKTDGTVTNIINPENSFAVQDARFGTAIAGATNRLIIGAPGYLSFGRAYLYDTNGTRLHTFSNPSSSAFDFFGVAVASNSTGTRVLIGAPGEDNGGTDAGVAYLYDMTTATPTLLKTITNPNLTNRGFGTAVAFVGNDILIGSPGSVNVDTKTGTTTSAPDRGAAYLFDGDGTTPTYALEITINNPSMGSDGFGGAIRVINDKLIAIGAPYTDIQNNTDAGAMYIYNLAPNTVSEWQIVAVDNFTSSSRQSILQRDQTGAYRFVYINDNNIGGVTALPTMNSLWQIAGIADFTGDKIKDIFLRNSTTGENQIWYKGISGSEIVNLPTINPNNVTVQYIGDFNGDSKADILLRDSSNGEIKMWESNQTNPNFIRQVVLPSVADNNTQIKQVSDLDGDGDLDILWYNAVTGYVAVWDMNGTNFLQGVELGTVSDTNTKIQLIANFDGDKDMDILWYNSTTGLTALWEMDGIKLKQGVVLNYVNDTNTKIKYIGNFDGDKDLDILWYNDKTGFTAIWEMDGVKLKNGISLAYVSDTNTEIQRVADFDGDGNLDIFWYNGISGYTAIWKMNGVNIGQGISLGYVSDTNIKIKAIANFDNDNDLDIFWHNETTGLTAMWNMNGANLGQGLVLPSIDTRFKFNTIGDFNGDGKPDIVWHNPSISVAKIWLTDGASALKEEILLPS